MYVAADQRGQGLGRKLLDQALLVAKASGFHVVVLETMNSMKAAMSLYEKAGFKPVDLSAASPRCDRVYRLEL
jgi:putative acetyltransferase